MVHELLGIQNGRVDLSLVPDIRPELKVCTVQACYTQVGLTDKPFALCL